MRHAVRAGFFAYVLGLSLAASGCMLVMGPHESEGPPDRGAVALTFDDGPLPGSTEAILDALRAAGARATFFVVGENVRRRPDLARRIVAEGHELGNHTLTHPEVLGLEGPARIAAEVDGGEAAIRAATGLGTALFRMPCGFTSHWVPPILAERDLVHVTFSARSHDWLETSPVRLARRVLDGARPGSILVLHDGSEDRAEGDRRVVVEALPLILDGLRARGLRVVGAAELLGIEWRRPSRYFVKKKSENGRAG
ncbi:MAG TPA: polysaccharide deacetylase family protein [Planctomycetota bacterium]|nr:polysaccharide deacetylase family protein [Planctomycetota bacterium]